MADDNIRHVNCASDFRIVFAFSGGKLPDYPWRLGLKTPNTPSYNMYVASFDGTTYNNCSPLDDESIMVFVDHHRLAPGILHYYLQTDAPDSLFPDGEMNVTIPGTVNIELWEGPSDGDTPPEVTVIVERLLKGDKGDPGEAGQITSATASIDNTTGTPSVKIELGGTPEKRTINLKFSGLKGEPGEPDESFVRYDEAQDLTIAQQSQVFENLGWKVHVIPQSAINSTDAVSDDEKEARLAATALLVQETGEMYIYGHNSSSTPSDRRFYRFRDTKTLALLNVVTTTGLITQPLFVNIYDENAVSFNIDQSNVSNDRKNKALGNIGIDLVRLPYSLLGTTLSDGMANVINNARGIILVDTPNDFILPTIYNKGRTTSTDAIFIAIGDIRDVYYISYNKNTKALATVVHNYTDTGCVRYAQEQSITNTQQSVARNNIGVQSADELLADDDFIAQLKTKLGIG